MNSVVMMRVRDVSRSFQASVAIILILAPQNYELRGVGVRHGELSEGTKVPDGGEFGSRRAVGWKHCV